ncbi:MAG: AAA family ATPase, partial [Nanoarchaeota archaeon]
MIFQRLEIRNFKSFVGDHTFDFTQFGPGLYFLTGQNLAEPELGANGVGKSTLWDALYWVIYGRTLRGLRAGECRSWFKPPKQPLKGRRQAPANVPTRASDPQPRVSYPPPRKKSCWGSLSMVLNREKVLIQRSWNPNNLQVTVNGTNKEITQEDLESLLGLDGESFQQSVIIGQFSRMFFDLRPAEKLTLFSELMDLEFWQKRSKDATAELEEIQGEYGEIEHQLISLRATRTEVCNARDNEREFQATYAQARAIQQKKIEDQIAEEVQTIEDLNHELKDRRKECSKLAKSVEGVQQTTVDNPIRSEEIAEQRIQTQLSVLENTVRSTKKQLSRLDRVQGQCPVCGQKVNENHIKSERNRLSGQLKNDQEESQNLEEKLNKIQKKIKILITEAATILTKNQEAARSHNIALREVQVIELDLVEHTERMKGRLSDLDNIKSQRSPHKTRIVEYEQRLKKLKAEISNLKENMNKLEGLLQAVSFWVKGFKDIRLSIIETTLEALTVEVNNYL